MPAPRDERDRGLVEALRAGDEAAFEELVDRYQSSLVRIALMLLHRARSHVRGALEEYLQR